MEQQGLEGTTTYENYYLVKFYRELKIFFNPMYVFECRQCVIKTSIVVPKTLLFTLLDKKVSNNEVKKRFVYIIET